jgi:hypothetical protein
MGPPAVVHERQWWADKVASDGLFATPHVRRNPYGSRRRGPKVFQMKNFRVTVQVRINVAACLLGIAAIIKVLT